MGVDADGNVYLAGSTNGNLAGPGAGPSDAWVVKYDGAGVRRWLRQFGTDHDAARWYCSSPTLMAQSILLEARMVPWAGRILGTWDAWLTRYDSAGNQQWLRQWGPA